MQEHETQYHERIGDAIGEYAHISVGVETPKYWRFQDHGTSAKDSSRTIVELA